MPTHCEKYGCKPRINHFGVSWCTECGKLFNFNLNHKPLNRNFLIKINEFNYKLEISKMETVKVYSPIKDSNIRTNLANSPIWEECYHETDTKPNKPMICYTIKFDGLKPIQVVKVSEEN